MSMIKTVILDRIQSTLELCEATIWDAITLEDGLDGAVAEAVIKDIKETLKLIQEIKET